ncbi:uncharacterized protein GIQ15_02181 [Arthroderma uncinatum]|uniref:uncharacterized protein n=1 Tax=Arthroderma uncinatum TaxID=74035 RepID=UPI00144ABED8|nr:uncharacterized protein GIQ15_02181 [Arthroderma uncinatum]KAF3482857.1 hypothetical protein GIQ15_02181 [Arthroderma uncinatum]
MAEGTSISATPVDETHDTSPPAFHAVHLNDVSGLAGRPSALSPKLWAKPRSELPNGASAKGLEAEDDEDEDDDDDDDEDVEEVYAATGGAFGGTEEDDFVAVDHSDASDYPWYMRSRAPARKSELDRLHPYVQLLSVSDAEACEKVEAAFPENQRCSKEHITYRLSKCPELSLGIFSIPPATADKPKPKPELIAHVLSTRTTSSVITNATMGVPKDWRSKKSTLPAPGDDEPIGHQDQGSTIAIHSLAVLPEHQDKGLGKMLIKSYIQRIQDAKIADRVVLLAHDHLLAFYTSLGFENVGRSKCTFGGGGWNDLVLELNKAN